MWTKSYIKTINSGNMIYMFMDTILAFSFVQVDICVHTLYN